MNFFRLLRVGVSRMNEYDDKFPPGLNNEEKAALEWKIEQDYERSETGAVMFKDEYLTFAVNFYTRNLYSLEDVVTQYRAHRLAAQRRSLADAFLTDMKTRLRERELAHN
jgi:hypothetical protein